MTLDEADKIIAELNICFPNKKLLVEEVVRWEENLVDYEYDDARRAVKQIENNCKFWPSWAEFREALIPSISERRALQAQQVRLALPEHEPTPEERDRVKHIIAEMKNKFSGRTH